jgi:hypothetical protein
MCVVLLLAGDTLAHINSVGTPSAQVSIWNMFSTLIYVFGPSTVLSGLLVNLL